MSDLEYVLGFCTECAQRPYGHVGATVEEVSAQPLVVREDAGQVVGTFHTPTCTVWLRERRQRAEDHAILGDLVTVDDTSATRTVGSLCNGDVGMRITTTNPDSQGRWAWPVDGTIGSVYHYRLVDGRLRVRVRVDVLGQGTAQQELVLEPTVECTVTDSTTPPQADS